MVQVAYRSGAREGAGPFAEATCHVSQREAPTISTGAECPILRLTRRPWRSVRRGENPTLHEGERNNRNGVPCTTIPSLPLPPMPDPKPEPTLQSEAQRLADAAKSRASEAAEELKVASNQLVDKVRDLIEDANVKRVAIKRGEKVLLEIPLTVGVGAGAAALLLNPVLSAVGALAALVSDVTLVIEREDSDEAADDTSDEAVANVNTPDAGAEEEDAADKTVGKPPAE